MKYAILFSIGIFTVILVAIGAHELARTKIPMQSETIYRTPSGHTCTEQDWTRQFMHGLKPGEEKCSIDTIMRPLTAQEMKAADRRREEKTHAEIEELKMNCLLLSRTPMSAMTPSDLKKWDFCKSIMVNY